MPPRPAVQKRNKSKKHGGLSGEQVDGAIAAVIAVINNPSNAKVQRQLKNALGVNVGLKRISAVKKGKKQKSNAKPAGKQTEKKLSLKVRRAVVKKACLEVIKRHDGFKTYANTTTTHIQEFFKKQDKKAPSKQTILRDIKKNGFVLRRRPVRPHTGTATIMEKRLKFCKARARAKAFNQNIFSDEHYITSNYHGPQNAFVPEGTDQRDMHAVDKGDWRNVLHLQVWGAIGVGWKSKLVNVSMKNGGRITSNKYKLQCLSPHRLHLKKPGKIFMQDGARYHTTKIVKKYCETQEIALMPDWPAGSPDLNPIEQLWAHLDREVEKKYPVGSKNNKIRFAQYTDVWDSIPQDVIDNFVLSFETKIKNCIKNNGD
jgi:transposase